MAATWGDSLLHTTKGWSGFVKKQILTAPSALSKQAKPNPKLTRYTSTHPSLVVATRATFKPSAQI